MVVISAPLRRYHVSHHNIYVHVYVCVWGSPADRQPTAETILTERHLTVTHHSHSWPDSSTHTRLASPESFSRHTSLGTVMGTGTGASPSQKKHTSCGRARATQITKRALKLL